MQFNFVVATNQVAVELWEKCGFDIVGTLYKAFKHKEKGFVDVFVMYKWFDQVTLCYQV
jgi:ribosomal protein S18 acetylase RimI-like enzyme